MSNTPGPTATSYAVGSVAARTAGKVFFSNNGADYVCSGTVVNTEGKSEVWTAGHCLTKGGVWNSNWVFVPNYTNGSTPYGIWSAYWMYTPTTWFNDNTNYVYDIGVAVMNRNNGNRIADYLGGQGIVWGQGTGQYVYAFGYPAKSPFDGSVLIERDGYASDVGNSHLRMDSNMTGGSSGGAWLISFNGEYGYINGHNDFKYDSSPQYMYSPYYGEQVASLFNSVKTIST